MELKTIRFSRTNQAEFSKTLRSRVNQYFKENNISRYGDNSIVVKTAFMLSLLLLPYVLLLAGVVQGVWWTFIMYCVMGLGAAGTGLCIMHDANHGVLFKNQKVNRLFRGVMYLLGGSPLLWRIQHNVLHHTYTNVEGMDEDIDPGKMLRFSPYKKRYKLHRLQHIYGWFLYGFMTISWVLIGDFNQLSKYHKRGLLKTQKVKPGKVTVEMILFKLAYYAYIIVIPALVLDISWWLIVIFWVVMQFITGLTLAMVFQVAHVVPDSAYPLPDEKGNMENHWAIHQLMTTANFSTKSKLTVWFFGGLTHQVEHHLFPNMCHIHYPKISKIVKETAAEFKLPYYEQKTFGHAIVNHARMLREFGKKNIPDHMKSSVAA